MKKDLTKKPLVTDNLQKLNLTAKPKNLNGSEASKDSLGKFLAESLHASSKGGLRIRDIYTDLWKNSVAMVSKEDAQVLLAILPHLGLVNMISIPIEEALTKITEAK